MNVLNDFFDILQNIEVEIVTTYKAHPEISDKDVLLATERLIGSYTRVRKKLPALPVFALLGLPISHSVHFRTLNALPPSCVLWPSAHNA